jgi:hypothetical protein
MQAGRCCQGDPNATDGGPPWMSAAGQGPTGARMSGGLGGSARVSFALADASLPGSRLLQASFGALCGADHGARCRGAGRR